MLTATSLSFIGFINLFLVPVISVRIYCRRRSVEWKMSLELVYRYVLMCVFNLPLGKVIALLAENFSETPIIAEQSTYTIVAVVAAVALPYIMEMCEKLIHVDVEIKRTKENKNNENQK